MVTASISIDVPSLEKGIAFYVAAFGFEKIAEPYPGVALLRTDDTTICLLEKPAGSKASPTATQTRTYERHWTPVHVDFHVENFSEAVDRAVAAVAVVEQRFDNPKHGSAAFCGRGDSQDAWVFEAPLRDFPCDFPLGVPGCDKFLAFQGATQHLDGLWQQRIDRPHHEQAILGTHTGHRKRFDVVE